MGMLNDATFLGDKTADWDPSFTQDIHGIIVIAGDSHTTVNDTVTTIEKLFLVDDANSPIEEVVKLQGDVRPGLERGHEQLVIVFY